MQKDHVNDAITYLLVYNILVTIYTYIFFHAMLLDIGMLWYT